MPTKGKKKTRDRQPMTATVAFSAEQLKDLGVPKWFTEDDLSEVLDRTLLNDDDSFREYIREAVEDYENER